MARYYRVISADGHVETPPDAWTKYVPEKYRDRAPRLIKLPDGGEGWLVEGQAMLHNGQNITGAKTLAPNADMAGTMFRNDSYFNPDGSAAPGAGDGYQRLREQDRDGLDAEALFPPVFATRFIEAIQDREVYVSMVQAYNTFLAQDFCSVAPDRLIGNGVIPVTGIDDAVNELKRCKELGLRSVAFHQFPNGSGGPKPEDDRFWETALNLGMCLSPHGSFGEGSAPRLTSISALGYSAFTAAITQTLGTGPVFPIVQMISSGAFDRFPELRVYIAETYAHWLPSTMWFLDDKYKLFRKWFDVDWKMLPSEYIRKHFYFSIIRDPMAMKMREWLPIDNIMWGTDFPHSVGSFPHSQEWLNIIFDGVPDDIRRKVTLETPAKFFGLDLDKPVTETPEKAAVAAGAR